MRFKLINKFTIKYTAMIFIIISLFYSWQSYQFMNSPMQIKQQIIYPFNKGSSLSGMISEFKRRGYIEHPLYYKIWARLSVNANKLYAGEYLIDQNTTPFSLLNKMKTGDVYLYSLTVIEGWNFKQLINLLQSTDKLVKTIKDYSFTNIMQLLGKPGEHPEGHFFPDTYRFPTGTTDIEFLRNSYNQMEHVLNTAWENRAKGLPLKSPYEALILASIVEKESASSTERGVIAGVFINRLNKHMRLQTDPTVIYGLGDAYKGDIRYRHLKQDTPYNTYTRRGLPPTPIALPGKQAIEATLNPEFTDYLYFVATGKNGEHYFSSTNAEHEKAVTKYQRRKKKKSK